MKARVVGGRSWTVIQSQRLILFQDVPRNWNGPSELCCLEGEVRLVLYTLSKLPGQWMWAGSENMALCEVALLNIEQSLGGNSSEVLCCQHSQQRGRV